MSHHPITINIKDGSAVPSLPKKGVMRVNDTVSYSSPDGRVRVLFDGAAGSPFGEAKPEIVRDSEIRLLQRSGKFSCKCFITPNANGSGTPPEIGWSEAWPQSGGDHDVRP